jgi:cytochrome c oxidase subunit II
VTWALRLSVAAVAGSCGLATGCTGVQSALDPQGPAALAIADLFWIMVAGGSAIWIAVVALALHAARRERELWSEQRAHLLIVAGAVVVPTLLLAVLLVYGLRMLPTQLAAAPPGSLRIEVEARQYWWRVRYPGFELANEIRLPRGQPVQFVLTSPDVIHSFWIPNLGGKMDVIPGRTTQLALTATRVGEYRGACAEFCGASHTWMAFSVVVMEPQDFAQWASAQAQPALRLAEVASGREAFASYGCGACHRVRGELERAAIGPDLTHVAGRRTLGAGLLPTSVPAFERWLARTDQLKPDVHMPAFGMLPAPVLADLATYLGSLR